MKCLLLCIGLFALIGPAAGISTPADSEGPAQTAFVPASDRGRVVVIASGAIGPQFFEEFASDLAKRGYYTVLLDGKDILNPDHQGGERLRRAIIRAQSSPHALPGKVAVIGFSRGGGGVLANATLLPALVAVVIAYYPQTDFIARSKDVRGFVRQFKVPVLAFVGGEDTLGDCCLVGTAREMEAAAKEVGASMEVVVYPNAKHSFIVGPNYRAGDAADAWQCTINALRDYLAR